MLIVLTSTQGKERLLASKLPHPSYDYCPLMSGQRTKSWTHTYNSSHIAHVQAAWCRFILMEADSEITPWTRICVSQADCILLVGAEDAVFPVSLSSHRLNREEEAWNETKKYHNTSVTSFKAYKLLPPEIFYDTAIRGQVAWYYAASHWQGLDLGAYKCFHKAM